MVRVIADVRRHMFYAVQVIAVVLSVFAFDAMACSVTPEFGRLSVTERAKWLYDRAPVVARVRVKEISSSRPHVAHVETIESFKGPPLTAVYEDFSTCGFQIKKDQDFIAFLPKDGAALSVHSMIPSQEYEKVIPVLRSLKETQ